MFFKVNGHLRVTIYNLATWEQIKSIFLFGSIYFANEI